MHRSSGIDPTLTEIGLSGEILLVGAILRQVVCDARLDQPSQTAMMDHEQAKTFLADQETIDWWAELVGADGNVLGHALRREAGLED